MSKAILMAVMMGVLIAPAIAPAGEKGAGAVVVPVGSANVSVIEIGVNPSKKAASTDSRQSPDRRDN